MIIIGGGPGGLMAGIQALKKNKNVTILERNDRPGKKLLASGNGRCNYTNEGISIERYHGTNPKFAHSALSKFGYEEAKEFFSSIGMDTIVLSKGRAYPRSLQASSVLDLLLLEFENLGGKIVYEEKVTAVFKDKCFTIVGENHTYEAESLVIATGGKTLKNTGSDGNGYQLAKSFGHKIITLGPAIVQMRLKDQVYKTMNGTRFMGLLKLYENDSFVYEDEDEILFTDYGISGPAVLQLSGRALEILNRGNRAYFAIDLFPEYDEKSLEEKLAYDFYLSKNSLGQSLIGKVNSNLIDSVLDGFDSKLRANSLSYKTIQKIGHRLKNWTFEIEGYKAFDGAQVTTGGVDTLEIDPSTIESKLINGLYFVGEVIDIDGDCGGFNLHWAWASAYACGNSI